MMYKMAIRKTTENW